MARRKFSNTESHYESMSLTIQLENVLACIPKHPEGSKERSYLEAERDILEAKLGALR
jgi:hypothetical protein